MFMVNAFINWRPKPPFYYGWLIIGMSVLATFASTGLSQVVLGGIQDFILDDMGWKRSTIALAATIGTWASGILAPFVGRLTDRYGPRWLMPFALMVAGASFFALAGIHSMWQFYVAYVIGRAITNPILIGIVPRTTAVNFFRRKRNLALSLAVMSRPVTGAINIRLIAALALNYGWRKAYQYLGILSLLLIIPAILIMRRRPEDMGLEPDGDESRGLSSAASMDVGGDPPTEVHSGITETPEFNWIVKEALRTPALWLIAMTVSLSTLSTASTEFILVSYLRDRADLSIASAAGILSTSNFLAVTSLGWGILADRFTPRRCLIIALVIAGIMILYLFTVKTLAMAYLFAFIWGICIHGVTALGLMILAQYFGRLSYGAIIGVLSPIQLGALGLGPILGAVIHDITGKYSGLQWTVLFSYILAAFLVFLARQPMPPIRANEISDKTT